jgi:hypothetical protein
LLILFDANGEGEATQSNSAGIANTATEERTPAESFVALSKTVASVKLLPYHDDFMLERPIRV